MSIDSHSKSTDVETGNGRDRKHHNGDHLSPSTLPESSSAENGDEKEKLITPTPAQSAAASEEKKQNEVFGGAVVFACSLYCFCSVSMVIVNKSLASRSVSPSPADNEVRNLLLPSRWIQFVAKFPVSRVPAVTFSCSIESHS